MLFNFKDISRYENPENTYLNLSLNEEPKEEETGKKN